MAIVVRIIIEEFIARSDSGNEAAMVDNSSVSLCSAHALEKFVEFIHEVNFFFIDGLPKQHLVPEGNAVV